MTVYTFHSTMTGGVTLNPDHTRCGIAFRESEDSPRYCVVIRKDTFKTFNVTLEENGLYTILISSDSGTTLFRSVHSDFAEQMMNGLATVLQPSKQYDVKLYVK
jgi:hypothetical protein